jgi:hypothetical protein
MSRDTVLIYFSECLMILLATTCADQGKTEIFGKLTKSENSAPNFAKLIRPVVKTVGDHQRTSAILSRPKNEENS